MGGNNSHKQNNMWEQICQYYDDRKNPFADDWEDSLENRKKTETVVQTRPPIPPRHKNHNISMELQHIFSAHNPTQA
jgi:hypothetical protein